MCDSHNCCLISHFNSNKWKLKENLSLLSATCRKFMINSKTHGQLTDTCKQNLQLTNKISFLHSPLIHARFAKRAKCKYAKYETFK